MARWARYLEIYLFCSFYPIMMVVTAYVGWKGLLWSYGGKAEFRKYVIKEPMDQEWFNANPKHVFFRDAPLARVPRHIIDKPSGDSDMAERNDRQQW